MQQIEYFHAKKTKTSAIIDETTKRNATEFETFHFQEDLDADTFFCVLMLFVLFLFFLFVRRSTTDRTCTRRCCWKSRDVRTVRSRSFRRPIGSTSASLRRRTPRAARVSWPFTTRNSSRNGRQWQPLTIEHGPVQTFLFYN